MNIFRRIVAELREFWAAVVDFFVILEALLRQSLPGGNIGLFLFILGGVYVYCGNSMAVALTAGEYCSGTSTGATRFYRVCDDVWLIVPLILYFVLILAVFGLERMKPRFDRLIGVLKGALLIVLLVSPWLTFKLANTSYFLTSTYGQ